MVNILEAPLRRSEKAERYFVQVKALRELMKRNPNLDQFEVTDLYAGKFAMIYDGDPELQQHLSDPDDSISAPAFTKLMELLLDERDSPG